MQDLDTVAAIAPSIISTCPMPPHLPLDRRFVSPVALDYCESYRQRCIDTGASHRVPLTIPIPAMTLIDDERTFFAGPGERMAQLRRARAMTQVQLAEALGVSQQTVEAYEVSRRRIPVSTLRLLAKTIDVSFDELMAEHAPRKRGPTPQIQRLLERISQLPKPKQRAVMDMMEALPVQQGRRLTGAR